MTRGTANAIKSSEPTAQCKKLLTELCIHLKIYLHSFAPFHKKADVLYAFAPDLCRSLGAKYEHPSRYNGVPTGFYSMDFGDIKVSWSGENFTSSEHFT